jgi:hypothetical protein
MLKRNGKVAIATINSASSILCGAMSENPKVYRRTIRTSTAPAASGVFMMTSTARERLYFGNRSHRHRSSAHATEPEAGGTIQVNSAVASSLQHAAANIIQWTRMAPYRLASSQFAWNLGKLCGIPRESNTYFNLNLWFVLSLLVNSEQRPPVDQ